MPYLSLQVPVPKLTQALSLARTLLPFVGGLLVMKGIMTQTEFASLTDAFTKLFTDVSVIVGLLTPVVTAVWGMISHSDASVVKAAADVEGVKVVVDPVAPAPVQAVAASSDYPNVNVNVPHTPPKP